MIVRPESGGQRRASAVKRSARRPVTSRRIRRPAIERFGTGCRSTGRSVFGGKHYSPSPRESGGATPSPCVRAQGAQLDGRKLAVSFHIAAESGPMTWHAKG